MKKYNNFDWGWMNSPVEITVDGETQYIWHINEDGSVVHLSEYHKLGMIEEIFEKRIYEKYFEVEFGDIVFDIGASVGPFTYSILEKKPKHVFCIEPSVKEIKTLVKNTIGYPVCIINKGISDSNSIVDTSNMFGGETRMESIKFEDLIRNYGIEKIDFLKTDCEGGEYEIFNQKNIEFIKNSVRKIAGEWHLNTVVEKNKFKEFRDNFLIHFNHYEINSIDGVDIKWDLFNDHFLEYYNQVIVYIYNS